MTDSQLPKPSQEDVDSLVAHLQGLGRRADPVLDELQVGIFVGMYAISSALQIINSSTDDAITIIKWLSKCQDIKHLLTRCSLFPKSLNIEVEDGRYVLIYHHEDDASRDLNIVGCEVRAEGQFRLLRAKMSLYAKWIRDVAEEEREAKRREKLA